MNINNNNITFLIAQRSNQLDFFDTFDCAVNFKRDANVVVLEDTNALKLVLENFSDTTKFRLLIHANIGENGTEGQTKKLQTVVGEIRKIIGNETFNPFFITRSGEIKKLCIEQQKCFVTLKDSDIMCSHTSKLADKNFLKELKLFSKKVSDKPKIFIGSSVQGLKIARAIRESLQHDATVHLWDDNGCFNTNETVLDGLEKIANSHDYGIFIFRPDDEIYNVKREETTVKIPRDNVIFEYGMFMGKHTRKKVFFIIPDPQGDLKLMSDLLGIIPLKYDNNKIREAEKETESSSMKLLYSEAVSNACDSIKTEISV